MVCCLVDQLTAFIFGRTYSSTSEFNFSLSYYHFYVSCLLTSTFLLGSHDVMSLFSLLADESGGVLPIVVKTSAICIFILLFCMYVGLLLLLYT